ncbi:DUF4381 domain-containing protein [Agaribacterium sp. ZY112]|uniref:DUF4381 domain-containing protein n=1 Tax=Agaribacterium sp. ZY112 TaxID=3233574 RepID=UPI0035248087
MNSPISQGAQASQANPVQDNPMQQQLLSALSDIHLTEAPSLWPLAMHQWLILTSLLLIVTVFTIVAFKRHQAKAYRRHLVERLDALALNGGNLSTQQVIEAVNILLKRCFIFIGRKHKAALYGERWYRTLLDERGVFNDAQRTLFESQIDAWLQLSLAAPNASEAQLFKDEEAIQALVELAKQWTRKHRTDKKRIRPLRHLISRNKVGAHV